MATRRYFKVRITETCLDTMEDGTMDSRIFNNDSKMCDTLQEAIGHIRQRYRYTKLESAGEDEDDGVYVDDVDGKTQRVGIMFRYWNRDVSHDSEPWLQEDWVEVCEVVEESVDFWTGLKAER